MVELKSASENLRLVFAGEFVGGLKGQREPRLIEFTAGVFFELHAQCGHDVECGVEAGSFAQHLHHAPVIFQGMQARPRQNILSGFRIAILRLVHVPQDHQVDAIHRLRPFLCESALVLHSAFLTCASWTATSSAKFSVMRSLVSLFSRLFSSCLSLSGCCRCLSGTAAPAAKSSNFLCAFSPAYLYLPSQWRCSSACCWAWAACLPTAKS